jgi:hypothetical protein
MELAWLAAVTQKKARLAAGFAVRSVVAAVQAAMSRA